MVPADPWLYSLLKSESSLVYGSVRAWNAVCINDSLSAQTHWRGRNAPGCAVLPWHGVLERVVSPNILVRRSALILAVLAKDGVAALGHEVVGSHVLFSTSHELAFGTRRRGLVDNEQARQPAIWARTVKTNSGRHCVEAKTGVLASSASLQTALETIEAALLDNEDDAPPMRGEPFPSVLFVAEIRTRQVARSPESLIGTIWNECLGARAIPFDPAARAALIADGCKHPELKRHLDAWQEMKRTDSKWLKQN